MSRDKQNIKTTDWLTRGMTEEEIAKEKEEAIKEAEAEHRDKQIDEFYELLTRDCETSCCECKFDRIDLCLPHRKAEALYNAGYCKSSEVAEEIFAEIEEIFNKRIAFYTDMAKQSKFTEKHYAETMIKKCKIYLQEIAELKKKYTESEKDNGKI